MGIRISAFFKGEVPDGGFAAGVLVVRGVGWGGGTAADWGGIGGLVG